jgi:hypothetical protein
MNLNNRIVIFSHDAGGANLTMSLAYFLYKENFKVLCFPKGPALKIFNFHIPLLISKENYEPQKNDVIITGTSGIHSDYEMENIKKYKNLVSKVICLLDSNLNLGRRFSLKNELLKEEFYPDEIWYEEKISSKDLPTLSKKIVIKENLYMKYLEKEFYPKLLETKNEDILKYKNNYLLVLTEYLFDLYGNEFGFDEFDFLENIFSVVKNLNKNIPIFLKFHPAEDSKKYDKLIKKYNDLNIYNNDYFIHEVLFNAKVVFGINSSVFKEALLLKKPVYSIQVSATKNLPLTNKVEEVTSKNKLKKILIENFGDKSNENII